ncbi:RecX family transcriptional regulator [Candidatus Saccharibacteria bacterium]|nr:RecX family transcriptional regulator [Candidatus Saccharibacteria bacterium]
MKITSIKQQVKNPDRASIFVDGKYSFSLSLNELLAEKLKTNLELSGADLKNLKKLSADGKLKARALEWVLNRPRSVREFKDYLRRKKADVELSELWAEEFQARGYLSNSAFAAWLIELRRRAGKSERAIRFELASKGVTREVAEENLQDNASELGRLRLLVNKKGQLPRYKADQQKFIQFLARKGFKYDDIKTVLSEKY